MHVWILKHKENLIDVEPIDGQLPLMIKHHWPYVKSSYFPHHICGSPVLHEISDKTFEKTGKSPRRQARFLPYDVAMAKRFPNQSDR
jgi:hypothetical protein